MVLTSRSSNLFSHQDKLLEHHLIQVARLANLFLKEKPAKIQQELQEIVILASVFHDIGKSTRYFQEYLVGNQEQRKDEKTRHSFLSALFGLFFSLQIVEPLKAFWVYYLILNHHRNLTNPIKTLVVEPSEIDVVIEQVNSIDCKSFDILLQNISYFYPLLKSKINNFKIETFLKFVENIEEVLIRLKRIVSKQIQSDKLENYILICVSSSILFDADKSEVVVGNNYSFSKREKIPEDLVENYLFGKENPKTFINQLRSKAYYEIVIQNLSTINSKILSINLPTGLGKTYASFSFALKLRKNLGDYHRIIYCLPFLSIIDQNFYEFVKILRYNNIDCSSNIILKHHHLGEICYRVNKDYPEFDTDISRILIEGWNSEIIVTTFYQLFHSLITNSNKNIRKFHRLANAIIILDEVQAIPIIYWKVVRKIFLELTEMLNSYVILVTATQPLIFEKSEIFPLCDSINYVNELSRINLVAELEPISVEEFFNRFEFENKRYLFILNTVNCAKKAYDLIKNKVTRATFLSTHLLPLQRHNRINEIKNGKYDVVVSTQLIEAGVDLDFDIVVRDIAPFDCIVQSAGRCNRNGKSKGLVKVINLVDNNKSYASYIYDPILLDITKRLLQTKKEYDEPSLNFLSNQYFEETNKKKSQVESKMLIDSLCKLIFEPTSENFKSVSDFSLIENDFPKIDIFVEFDSNAKKIWNEFLQISQVNNFFERKNFFDRIKKEFFEYVVSIPKSISNLPEKFFGELGFIPNEEVERFYDNDTGFITKSEQNLVII